MNMRNAIYVETQTSEVLARVIILFIFYSVLEFSLQMKFTGRYVERTWNFRNRRPMKKLSGKSTSITPTPASTDIPIVR